MADETEGVDRHKSKMANRKAVQDAEVASKTIEKGLLIVHTGKGKGKSTAAFGLLLRALGRGFRAGRVVNGQSRCGFPLNPWCQSGITAVASSSIFAPSSTRPATKIMLIAG